MSALSVGSLFSGIGGLDLGLERAGMTVIWQSEVDPYCCRVLAKHWPDVPNLGDVTKVDWSSVERPDVICGGYPCQPFSLAGARAGEDDARHLWPYMVGAIRLLRPRFAVMENVPGHLSLGFGRVLGDLAESGYDTEWDCVPAAAVGAPHRRDRVWVVAYAHGESESGRAVDAFARSGQLVPDTYGNGLRQQPVGVGRRSGASLARDDGTQRDVADTNGERLERAEHERLRFSELTVGSDAGAYGDAWTVEPNICRMAHGVPSRVDRLRGLGNAVVPQVAEFIGRQLMAAIS